MKKKFFVCLFFISLIIPLVSAAHYIVGTVNDARDGTTANEHMIILWNPAEGINDNQTDFIGQSGNSGTDNIYMIDCELLDNSCNIGDVLNLKVLNNGDNHFSSNVSVIVSGAGYDIVSDITISSIINITSIFVDDDIVIPSNQIDLFAGSNRTVTCRAIVDDYDGVGINNATAKFFDNVFSFYSEPDNGNRHYSNNSCFIDSSYGINESEILCDFQVAYYAYSSYWNCTLSVVDNNGIYRNHSSSSFINPLLSIEISDFLSFNGSINSVSSEKILNVTNYGNVKINLSLYGYSTSEGDNYAMNCSNGKNIPISYEKYNLTASNPGNLNFLDFEAKYVNLTSNSIVKMFNLDFKHGDDQILAFRSTYWRIFIPGGISSSCTGNVVFGASQLQES